ncbi:DNA-binding SARP family transcriptional activator/Tfp pilus assembly protein PilF [Crossiella equi]|uniref:DNA-binding SARP family transcriptional activator/Tfp pilus assembly protein PilF n=1 Tax=Crossiella equi TaxID=130796 RepID=A0ABS5APT6_9PSEU|nr:BTAD domain-containing putative transcriptional regulator [Crossiella equi]MBP2478582.1 DNA-binding SARP family transcriptional activator/Tfp pilus assembly protein PilF [Crossiella equi]
MLGTVSVEVDGRPVPLGGAKPRTLLAALLARSGGAVGPAQLVDLIWRSRPPASARAIVQTYASTLRGALRKAGVPDLLVSDEAGYRVVLGGARYDLPEFEDAVLTARERLAEREFEQAAELLREALGLWHGPAFAGLGDGFLRAEAERLDELRLAAVELRCTADLECGRYERLVPELRGLTAEYPLREPFWALLMLALARSGQQSAALAAYEQIRSALREEFGSDPGPQLLEAYEVVLHDEPRPATSSAEVPMQLPADLASFAGRTEDLAALDGQLPEAGASAPRAIVVVGPGGIGKTALAVRWAHRVRDRFPDGQLFVDLRGYDPVSPVSTEQALTGFLRSLGVSAQRVPVTLEEQVALYRSLLVGKRVLVVLDNAAGAGQVRPLLPTGPGCLALVTSRGDLRSLAVLNDARVRYLEVLSPADSLDLLAELCGPAAVAAEPEDARRLAALCGHLPLALRIAAANLHGRRHTRISDYVAALREDRLAELAIDDDPAVAVQATFHLSYQALDPATRQVFRLLGLAPGPDFSQAAAVAMAGVPGVPRSLDRLVSASLLSRGAGGRYQFHDLIRDFAADRARAEDGPAELRAAETRLYDHYLGTASAGTALFYAGVRRLRETPTAVVTPFADGEAALRWLDEERVNLVAAAERAAAVPETRHYSGWLADVLRGYFSGRGYAADGLALSTAALAAARESGDAQAEVAVHALRALIFYNLSDYEGSIAEQELALAANERDPNPVAELECLHHLGRTYAQLGVPREAMAHHERALAIATAIGDELIEAREVNYVGVAHLSLGNIDEATRCHTRALEIARRLDDKTVRLRTLNGLGLAHWTAGRLAEAAACHRECVDLCRSWGLAHNYVAAVVCLAETCCDLGRYEEAAALARDALERGQRIRERRHEASALEIHATVRRRLGHYEESIRGYTEALALASEIKFRYGEASILIGLSAAHRAVGQPAEAADCARQALAKMHETDMRVLEIAGMTELAACHLDLGELAEATGLVETALELAVKSGQRLSEARTLGVLGRIRHTEGEVEAAAEHWRAALELFTEIGAPEAEEIARLLG